jgi:GNAT superfamily N-acetyltransferase
MSSPPIEVELLSRTAHADAALMERISELANEVYAAAEAGLWTDGATRTSVGEIAELTRAGQIAVARMGGHVVGCVRLQRLDERTGEFGMLCADPAHRGIGIGRDLIRFAERNACADGIRTMQLELLVPREWTHPTKQFLAEWYSRIGYRIARTGTIDELYPELAPLLATPSDFVIYRKELTTWEP